MKIAVATTTPVTSASELLDISSAPVQRLLFNLAGCSARDDYMLGEPRSRAHAIEGLGGAARRRVGLPRDASAVRSSVALRTIRLTAFADSWEWRWRNPNRRCGPRKNP